MNNTKEHSILFAMRYNKSVGFVWNSIRRRHDAVSKTLSLSYNTLIAYPEIDTEDNECIYCSPIELDLYNFEQSNRLKISAFLKKYNVIAIVYMSATPSSINLHFLKKHKLLTFNTENDSYNTTAKQNWVKSITKFIIRSILKRQLHDIHIANSFTQGNFLKSFAKIPSDHLKIVCNGIDSSLFTPGDKLSACNFLNLDPNRIYILNIGQARAEKRILNFIDIAKKFKDLKSDVPITFVYVGDGPLFNEIKQYASTLKLNENDIIFAGESNDINYFYQASSLLIHLSERESFGNVIVEAMLSELPVISTSSSGPSEIILHNETGFLIPNDRPLQAFDFLLKYINDFPLMKKHGRAGRKRALNNYDLDRNSQQMANLILDALTMFKGN